MLPASTTKVSSSKNLVSTPNLSSCVPVKRTARIGGQGRRQAAAAAPAAADIVVGVVPRRHAALHAAPTSSLLHNICILCERCISPMT